MKKISQEAGILRVSWELKEDDYFSVVSVIGLIKGTALKTARRINSCSMIALRTPVNDQALFSRIQLSLSRIRVSLTTIFSANFRKNPYGRTQASSEAQALFRKPPDSAFPVDPDH